MNLVEHPRKPAPEEVLKLWAQQWSKEGVEVDSQKLIPPRGFPSSTSSLGCGAYVPSWIDHNHNRRMSKDYERLTEPSEAFIYVAMRRLMVRRLARS